MSEQTRNPLLIAARAFTPPCRAGMGRPIRDAVPQALDELRDALVEYAERVIGVPQFAPDMRKAPLGCGMFGCAFKTLDSNVVVKLTTDSAEAMLAGLLRHLPRQRGVLDHYGVLALPTPANVLDKLMDCEPDQTSMASVARAVSRRGRLYAIWRENCAWADKNAEDFARRNYRARVSLDNDERLPARRTLHEGLAGFAYAKTLFRNDIGTAGHKLAGIYRYIERLWPVVERLNIPPGPDAMVRVVTDQIRVLKWEPISGVKFSQAVMATASVLEGIRETEKAGQMASIYREVAKALAALARAGVILTDISPPYNLGLRKASDDYVVILDAGFGLVLNPRLQRIWIDGAGEEEDLFWTE